MKKRLSIICIALLCACCLGLAACGGSASSSASSASASASASSASESSPAADPTAKFIGDWKLAAMMMQGVTVTGDISAITGEDASASLVISEGGTGTVAFGSNSATINWSAADDNTLDLTITGESTSDSLSGVQKAVYADGAISMELTSDNMTGTFIFTKDGTYDKAPKVDISTATAITSADQLTGTWTLAGMSAEGAMVSGSAESIGAIMGGSIEGTLTFNQDGTVAFMGSQVPFNVSDQGTTIGETINGVSLTFSVKALGDQIVIDASSLLGMDAYLLFSK